MNYTQWQESAPEAIRGDSLWKMTAYRLALFLGDVAWRDVTKLAEERRTPGLSDQLYRAAGSISANLAEGYSRATRVDRIRFLGYSLGSVRECVTWYSAAQPVLTGGVVHNRLDLIMRVRSLLLGLISSVRRNGDGRSPFQW